MSQLLINLSMIFPQPTGISNYATNIFPYLKSLHPTLLTAQTYPEFNCYLIPNNLTPAQGTKGHLYRLLWTQFQLPKIYKKLSSHLLFSPVPEAPVYSGCRFVVMVHDLIALRFPKRFSPLTNYQRYYVPQVLQQAQHIICNSHATAKDVVEFYKIPAQKITPILLGYDAKRFRPLERKASKWKTQCPYFLYLGRHDPYKNLHRLISAFAALRGDRDRQLWLAGPADKRYTPMLQVQVAQLGIAEQVKFLNYIADEDLPEIINGAIALVFPSLWEGFGLPVLEAMACGTPVITSKVSSLVEVAGDAAILVDPYNVEEMAWAMEQVATDTQLRDRLCAAAIARAGHFSWEKTATATIEVLKQYL
jgi:glycosyltransferase involved in cell wall biosynthesis